jgi:hypothetical protein
MYSFTIIDLGANLNIIFILVNVSSVSCTQPQVSMSLHCNIVIIYPYYS